MYFSWKEQRIIAKIAVWAAREGEASQFLYTLGDTVTERVSSGELEEASEGESVGIPRNANPIEVDEPDRRLWMYFCHPAGEAGEFAGHPVDYKFIAPGAPVEGNRAFDSSVDDADGIFFIAASGEGAETDNTGALEALTDAIGADDTPPLHILLPPKGTHKPDPEDFRRRHAIPDRTAIHPAEPWNGDVAWREFLDLADAIRPRIEQAVD